VLIETHGLDMRAVPVTTGFTAMTEEHWPQVCAVYAEGIATGHATFEAEPPTWSAFDAARLPEHRIVAVDDHGAVLGWVALTRVSARPVYAGVVEHSVFVAREARGRGVGRRLLDELITSTEAAGIWTIQSGIFPENAASIAVHQAAGFRVIGRRERLGLMGYGPMAGRWRDVVMLERRSTVVG